MRTTFSNFYCFDDPHSWKLKGTIDSEEGTFMQLRIMKCNGTDCKKNDEIAEYVNSHSLIVIRNKSEYMPSEYADKTIKHTITSPVSYKLGRRGFWQYI